jgi:hypothetical protein
MTDQRKDEGRRLLLQYAGFATQLVIGLGTGVLAGYWLDKKIDGSIPVFTWLLPLLVLLVMFWKVMKDTSKK